MKLKEALDKLRQELKPTGEEELLAWYTELGEVAKNFTNDLIAKNPSKHLYSSHAPHENGMKWLWSDIIEIPDGERAHIGTLLKVSVVREHLWGLHEGTKLKVASSATLLGHGFLHPFATNDYYYKFSTTFVNGHSSEEKRKQTAGILGLKLPYAMEIAKAVAYDFPNRIPEIMQTRLARGAFAPDQDLSRIAV